MKCPGNYICGMPCSLQLMQRLKIEFPLFGKKRFFPSITPDKIFALNLHDIIWHFLKVINASSLQSSLGKYVASFFDILISLKSQPKDFVIHIDVYKYLAVSDSDGRNLEQNVLCKKKCHNNENTFHKQFLLPLHLVPVILYIIACLLNIFSNWDEGQNPE